MALMVSHHHGKGQYDALGAAVNANIKAGDAAEADEESQGLTEKDDL